MSGARRCASGTISEVDSHMPTAKTLIRHFKKIKTLPHISARLSKLISDENTLIQELEEVVKLDPTLVVRVLPLINSAYYGLHTRVESIATAIVYIGFDNLRNMIITHAIKEIFRHTIHEEHFPRERLWFHSAVVGICAQMVSERIFGKKGEDAFMCGILHDIGLIIEDQVKQKLFKKVYASYQADKGSIVTYENEIIGTNHCEIGCLLARDWHLPVDVKAGIRNIIHHRISSRHRV